MKQEIITYLESIGFVNKRGCYSKLIYRMYITEKFVLIYKYPKKKYIFCKSVSSLFELNKFCELNKLNK